MIPNQFTQLFLFEDAVKGSLETSLCVLRGGGKSLLINHTIMGQKDLLHCYGIEGLPHVPWDKPKGLVQTSEETGKWIRSFCKSDEEFENWCELDDPDMVLRDGTDPIMDLINVAWKKNGFPGVVKRTSDYRTGRAQMWCKCEVEAFDWPEEMIA